MTCGLMTYYNHSEPSFSGIFLTRPTDEQFHEQFEDFPNIFPLTSSSPRSGTCIPVAPLELDFISGGTDIVVAFLSLSWTSLKRRGRKSSQVFFFRFFLTMLFFEIHGVWGWDFVSFFVSLVWSLTLCFFNGKHSERSNCRPKC